MADEVEALKATRKAMMREIMERSKGRTTHTQSTGGQA